MTSRRYGYMIAAAVVAVLTLPACYTLLKHPKVRRGALYEDVGSDRCTTCHYGDELWNYLHPPNQASSFDVSPAAWDAYYFVPWWYTASWRADPHGPPENDYEPSKKRSATPARAPGQMGSR